MHTEEQARKLWCPFARADAATGGSHNRDFQGGPAGECRCIASECMAWRWAQKESNKAFAEQARTGKLTAPLGYCGLAGRPE